MLMKCGDAKVVYILVIGFYQMFGSHDCFLFPDNFFELIISCCELWNVVFL